jgi:hypothetical protein
MPKERYNEQKQTQAQPRPLFAGRLEPRVPLADPRAWMEGGPQSYLHKNMSLRAILRRAAPAATVKSSLTGFKIES